MPGVAFCLKVGTGFSFTKADAGYATNEVDVGRDLYRYSVVIYIIYSPVWRENVGMQLQLIV